MRNEILWRWRWLRLNRHLRHAERIKAKLRRMFPYPLPELDDSMSDQSWEKRQ